MKVELNDAERRLAGFIAQSRYRNARKRGIPNLKKGPQSNEETDLEGIGAEIAACKVLNVYPDLETDCEPPTFDCLLNNGLSVDVKSTQHIHGKLIAALWKKGQKSCDLYVLITGVFPIYFFAGCMSGADLMKPERITDLGRGPVYAAIQSELHPVPDFR